MITGTKAAIEVAKGLIQVGSFHQTLVAVTRYIFVQKTITKGTLKAASRVGQPPLHLHEMMIPGYLVAKVIGKGGEVIKEIQADTGVKIIILQETKE